MSRPGFQRGAAISSIIVAAIAASLATSSCGSTVTMGSCGDGYDKCASSCVDLQTDPDHCGACGSACPEGVACAAGACGMNTCPPGSADCGEGSCVDLGGDPQNCGGCGVACPQGTSCADGACQGGCPTGTAPCFDFCADLGSDPENCGGCGISCGPGVGCLNGACQSSCGSGDLFCGGSCVDPTSDPLHCGGCFQQCGPNDLCVGGACEGTCPGGGCEDCFNGDLGGAAPQSISGSTAMAGDDVAPNCGPPGGPDRVFTFTPAHSGVYTFTTAGSTFDTVLYVLAGGCSGTTLACNDDALGVLSSVTLALSAGQTVAVVIDGFGASQGNFVLNVSAN